MGAYLSAMKGYVLLGNEPIYGQVAAEFVAVA